MARLNTERQIAIVVRWIGALIFAFTVISKVMAQVPGTLNPQYAEGLKAMNCGSCVELSSVVRVRAGFALKPGSAVFHRGLVLDAATEADLANAIGVAEGIRAKTAHVCVGASRKVNDVMILPIPEAERGGDLVNLRAHPDDINGICIGSLLPIEVFLETVMSDIFARRLKEFDARLSPEKVEAMVRNRLADALASERALMTDQIKREVVAELKGQSSGAAGGGVNSSTDSRSLVCVSGASTCPGKSHNQCCKCLDHPNVEGTCDAQATPQSWRPREATP